jgi:hypothetical protein
MITYATPQAAPFLYRVGRAKRNFIVQQGFSPSCPTTCDLEYSALLFMPRLLGLAFVTAAVLRLPTVFFALGVLLWWCVVAPRFNPLNALYNWVLAPVSGVTLTPAPAPRRFSQFLGGTFALAIAASQATGAHTTALVLQAILLAAVSAVVFGGFCLGSFLFHVLRGRPDVAMQTLPWAGDAWLRALAQRGPGGIVEPQSATKDTQAAENAKGAEDATDAADAKDAKVIEDAKDAPATLTCEMQIQMAGCLW